MAGEKGARAGTSILGGAEAGGERDGLGTGGEGKCRLEVSTWGHQGYLFIPWLLGLDDTTENAECRGCRTEA